jgi:hypothetical protein
MPLQFKVEGHLVTLPPELFYEHWMGLAYSTCSLGGIMGGFLDDGELGKSLLESHAAYLEENIPAIEDSEVQHLFRDLADQFDRIIELDKLAIEGLSADLQLPVPSTAEEWKRFRRKFYRTVRAHGTRTYLEEPALMDLYPRWLEIQSAMRDTRLRILSRILDLFPALARAEYVHPGDRIVLNI